VTKVTERDIPNFIFLRRINELHGMKTTTIHSYRELEEGTRDSRRAFLLLYKSGTEQSECALNRIATLSKEEEPVMLTADVNEVRDIHEKLNITTAPSLVVFNNGTVVNIFKGCQTESAYESIIAGREIGTVQPGEVKPVKSVTVYTTPTCSWCTTLKTYLKENRVQYREINVAADTSAAEAMVRKSGQQGVPQAEINGQMIVGFDKARINQLLEIK
jgi:glutaredoxin-like YruB-family protein